MWTIIKWELWQRRWSLLWWTIAIVLFIALNMSVYPSFRDQAAQLNQTFNQMPQGLREMFSDTGDFMSPAGYMSSQIYYLMLPMLLSVLAISMGASLIAREEQQGTLELILARPVSRTKFLLAKIGAGAIILIGIGAVAALTLAVLVQAVNIDVSRKGTLLAAALAVLLSALFGTIAFTFSALGRPARAAALGIAALFAIGSYIISSLDKTVHWLQWPAKLLPYHYYRPGEIVTGTSNGTWPMIGFAVVILALGIISWIGFRRRDIG